MQRFRDGFTAIPPMRELGRLWDRDRALAQEAARGAAYVIGAELGAHGVDFSFAPVLDLDYGRARVIGDRALHFDPQRCRRPRGGASCRASPTPAWRRWASIFPVTALPSPTRT